jgi:hypothetical protein
MRNATKGANMDRTETQIQDQVTIRPLSDEDRESVVRLAQLDSSRVPEGDVLGAVVAGRLVAAISLTSGDSVANPFIRSEGARSMLELRAGQVNGKGRGLFRRWRRRRARGSIGAQPAGAGGRVLTEEQPV